MYLDRSAVSSSFSFFQRFLSNFELSPIIACRTGYDLEPPNPVTFHSPPTNAATTSHCPDLRSSALDVGGREQESVGGLRKDFQSSKTGFFAADSLPCRLGVCHRNIFELTSARPVHRQ
jgi:hypothetical protein